MASDFFPINRTSAARLAQARLLFRLGTARLVLSTSQEGGSAWLGRRLEPAREAREPEQCFSRPGASKQNETKPGTTAL